MITDQGILESNSCNPQIKEPGVLFHSRVPLNPSDRNAANSADFCSNGRSYLSTNTRGIVSKNVDDSFSSTQFYTPNSKAYLRKIPRSMQPRFSECKIDWSEGDTPISRTNSEPLVEQGTHGFTVTQRLRASDSRTRSPGGTTLTQRQRNLRSFIAKQRNKQATKTEEKSDTGQEEMVGYETPQESPTSPLRDDVICTDMPKTVTKVKKELHDGVERSQSEKSLVGTDILCDVDISIGQLSENDEASSIMLEKKSPPHTRKVNDRRDDTSLPILYLGSFQQSLWLDFGDDRSNIVGSSRSLQFQLRAPQSLLESSSASSSSSIFVDDDCCIVKVEKVPLKKGFTLIFLDPFDEEKDEESADTTTFSIANGKSRKLMLTWKPMESGGMREIIYLKLQRGRIRIIAHGKARVAQKKKTTKARKKVLNNEQTQMQGQPVAIREHLSTCLKSNKNYSLGFDSWVNKNDPQETTSPTKSTTSSSRRGTNGITSSSPRGLNRTLSLPVNSDKTIELPTKIRKSSSFADPFWTRSMYNDAWADKQCNTYQEWLNFLFQHRDGMHDSMLGVDAIRSNEQQTIRNLLLQRQVAHSRQTAIIYYRGPEMLAIRNAIELDVDNRRLFFRTDPYVLANLSLHSRLVSLLLSYSVPWLRLGLETIFGETITPNSSSKSLGNESETHGLSGMKRGGQKKTTIKVLLKKIIIERILSDPNVKMKFTRGKCMMPSGKFEVLYKEEMGRHVLKRILLLVVFLDHAKADDVIHSSPCLFNKNGIAKSTKDFLAILCKDYIHGIGDLSKHLGFIGISVFYTQSHIEELDFSISNMAVDLRDGTRLAKLAEILSGDSKSSTLKKLRLPAVSRLQKIHNLKVALSAFSDLSIPNIEFVQPEHIVDGHRPQVLQFLWSIISHFNLSNLLDMAKLKEETDVVHRTNKRTGKEYEYFRNATQNDDGKQSDERCNLLLRWCRAVCWSYDVEVNDFSKSFSDGKVICCLVNFYHPNILRRDEILPTASDIFHYGVSVDDIKKDPHLQQQHRKAIENEHHNSALANKIMKEIGGIPHVLPISDSTTIPDERSTIISIAYLCSRLLESSAEILATTIIQKAFRKYQNKKLHELKRRAAMLISLSWSKYVSARTEQWASTKIQRWLRQCFVIRTLRENATKYQAARRIQAAYRGYMLNGYILFTSNQIIMIQKVWRSFICQCQYQVVRRNQRAAILIQRCWSKYRVAKLEMSVSTTIQTCFRRHYAIRSFHQNAIKYKAARKIQAIYRCWKLKGYIRLASNDIIIIQKVWRSFLCRCNCSTSTRNAVLIQKMIRRKLAYSVAASRQDAIISIQCAARRYLAVCKINRIWSEMDYRYRLNLAAITCQAYTRQKIAMKYFHAEITRAQAATTLIQKAYRHHIYRLHSLRKNEGATKIQALYRGRQTRILRSSMTQSVVTIQIVWRRFSAQLLYNLEVSNIVYLQSAIRGQIGRRAGEERTMAVAMIQKICRKYLVVRSYRKNLCEYESSRKIQTIYRSYRMYSNFANMKESASIIQAFSRRILLRRHLKHVSSSVLLVQKYWRGFSVCLQYKFDLSDIVFVQSLVRKKLAAGNINERKTAIMQIQSAYRKWIALRITGDLTEILHQNTTAHEAAMVCQAWVRRWIVCKAMKEEKIHSIAALLIQRNWRCHILQSNHTLTVQAVKVIQNFVRYWIKIMIIERNHDCALRIQGMLRGASARSLAKRHIAARTIQKHWRCYVFNVNYMISIFAVITLQMFIRQHITRYKYQRIVKGINALQSQTRGLIVRKCFKEQVESASSIQRWWKTVVLSQIHKFAATKIQRLVRSKIFWENLRVHHSSACNIQKCWRSYHTNTNFMLTMLSIIKIQSFWRQASTKWRVVPEATLLVNRTMQGSFYPRLQKRSHLWMVIEFQKRWRRRSARMKFLRARKGFITLQSLFRGQCIRRLSSRKMSALAKRVARANIIAGAKPQLILGAKTSNALRILQRSQRLTEIMDAVRTLEISTGLSPNCCIAFTVAEAHDILYHLIRSCNRSLPHVELLQFILMTLSNVSNHSILISRIATSESIDILIDLIQMFRDKDSIFCLASTLLELLALSEDMFILQCKKRENLKRISGVHNLCLRKLSLIKNNSTGSKSVSRMRQSKMISKDMSSAGIRSNSAGSKNLSRRRQSEMISKEMSSGIRALQRLLQKTSKHGQA